jgi:hypothetical protein
MIRHRRESYNRQFSQARHEQMTRELEQMTGAPVQFHLSETPCFLPNGLLADLIQASNDLVHQLLDNPAYRRAADEAVPPAFRLSSGEKNPTYLQVDFGLLDVDGRIEGRLVELQAFPSLYGFQVALAEACMETHDLEGLSPFFEGITRDSYLTLMRRAMVGPHDPAEVVLMEIDPLHQKTLPDFVVTERLWGVRAVNLRDVVKQGRRLFYPRDGMLTPISRIYNRVIPDELERKNVTPPFDYRDDLDVEWTGGPDWFFRISKFSIPWLKHPWVPRTHLLSDLSTAHDLSTDRERWLLKPLFSFAGGGILFAPTDDDIAAIPEHEHHLYVLQERIDFTPVIDTPFGMTKVEVRIMMVRDGEGYRAVLPLLRLGRGRMMGVDFNKGQSWVGSAAGLQEA